MKNSINLQNLKFTYPTIFTNLVFKFHFLHIFAFNCIYCLNTCNYYPSQICHNFFMWLFKMFVQCLQQLFDEF